MNGTHRGVLPSFILIPAALPNDLPFSSERQGRVRAYHGREEPRAQPAASRHEPTNKRTCVAFVCCNGLLASVSTSSSRAVPRSPPTSAGGLRIHRLEIPGVRQSFARR